MPKKNARCNKLAVATRSVHTRTTVLNDTQTQGPFSPGAQ